MTDQVTDQVCVRSLRVGSFHTEYLEGGDPEAPTVVLIHDGAWGADAWASWSSVAQRLAASFRVIVPDLLGFGATAKAVFFDQSRFAFRWRHVCDLLDLLEVDGPVHAAGASFGGSIVLRAAAEKSAIHRLRSAASISGTGGPYRRGEVFQNLAQFDGTDESMRRIMTYLVDDFEGLEEQIRRRQRNVRQVGHYQSMGAVRMEAFAGEKPADPTDPFPETLVSSSIPLLLVEGARDELLEDGWAAQLREEVGRGTVVSMDSRHSPNIDRAAEVSMILEDFFSTAEVGSQTGR